MGPRALRQCSIGQCGERPIGGAGGEQQVGQRAGQCSRPFGDGGGILAVINRQAGIGVFSPRLDEAGNSVRGKLTCIGLADALGLHAFDATNPGSSFLRGLSKLG